MNLPRFLKEVDDLSAKLSHDELEAFIHEVARTLPEGKRNYFLDLLRKTEPQDIVRDNGYAKLIEDIKTVKDALAEINDEELRLDSEYNEEWDEWYNSDADEVIFMDPQGLLHYIDRAMSLVHLCIDMEAYKEGFELAEALSVLEVFADGDYADFSGEPLVINELSGYNLLARDFKSFVKESLYLAYMGNELNNRADSLYCMIENLCCHEISLEDILQSGNNELPQFNEFLPLWISYLGAKRGRNSEKFLKEALIMLQDDDSLLETARRFVDEHPSLYEQLLRMKLPSAENEKMLEIGREALDKIPKSYVIRSNIALLAAEYASRLNNYDELEKCWFEAFSSNSTAINYLRLRLRSREWLKYAEDVKLIYEQAYTGADNYNTYDGEAQRKNRLHKKDYCVLLFFDEQFDSMLTIGMNTKKALGWSETFMKEGLALVLLLIYRGKELPKGLMSMLHIAASASRFDPAEYLMGTGGSTGLSIDEMFWDLFRQWRISVQLSESETDCWLGRILKWIDFRVKGIIENSRTKYYWECAAFIAAFGEVRESLGISFAKARIMEEYKSKYSRRSAFHRELRNYGMRK